MIISAKRIVVWIVYLMALSILILLGTWQLVRGLEKAQIERLYTEHNEPIELAARPLNWAEFDYRSTELVGNWLWEREFLLENRIHHGQPGYEVLTPFELSQDKALLLVNRGWIDSTEVVDASKVRYGENPPGVLYRPELGFTLGQTLSGEIRWPQTVLYLDIEALSRHLGRMIEPAVLVLDPDYPAAYTRIWQPTALPATRHYGYAAQWWGLALVLIILGLIWYRSSHTEMGYE